MPKISASRMHQHVLSSRSLGEKFPKGYCKEIPSDLFGPRSLIAQVERYSPSYMTEMYGAGVPEAIHQVDESFLQRINSKQLQPSRDSESANGNTKERIIFDPNDDRKPISQTTMPPWRCICRLETVMTSGKSIYGTGWFAAPNIVVTAGHCLYDEDGNEPTAVIVIPGYGPGSMPYGNEVAHEVRVPQRWIDKKDDRYDFGIVIMPSKNLGNSVGWFGFAVPKDSHLDNMLITSAGYPDDYSNETQVSCLGRVRSFSRHFINHNIDTVAGQSGSPIYHKHKNSDRTVIGIHTDGGGADQPNVGVRITSFIFDQISKARQDNK